NVLADFEVAFTTASELVVEGIREFRQFSLRHEMMGDPAQVLGRAMVEEVPHPLAGRNAPKFLAQADVVGELLFELIPFGIAVGAIYRPLRYGMGLGLVHEIGDPSGDG